MAFKEKEVNTVWRVTEEDVRAVLEDRFPLLTEEEKDILVDKAYQNFSVVDWVEQVNDFLMVEANNL